MALLLHRTPSSGLERLESMQVLEDPRESKQREQNLGIWEYYYLH